MPGFESHITTSTTIGVGIGVLGYSQGMPLTSSIIAAGLCGLGGMLPDMDGDTGVPVRETLAMVAAVVAFMMIDLFRIWGFDREMMVIGAGAVYLFVRFGIGAVFKNYTVHRGMWHSIPAALTAGMVVFLVCSYQDFGPRLFKSVAVTIGFLSHLVLDEMASFEFENGRLRIKRSLGTALKFWSNQGWWPNVSTYGKLAVLFGLSFYCFNCAADEETESTSIATKDLLPVAEEMVITTSSSNEER